MKSNIASLKAKILPNNNSNASNDNGLAKKIEVISASLKNTPTILARDLKVEGEINSSGLLEIEGMIKGKIVGNSVILREEGFVEGEIFAESLSLRGHFEGKIKAAHLNISSKAKVHGEIEYESMSVEDGACIDGNFKKIS